MFKFFSRKNKKSSAFGRMLNSKENYIAYNIYCFNSNSNGELMQHA